MAMLPLDQAAGEDEESESSDSEMVGPQVPKVAPEEEPSPFAAMQAAAAGQPFPAAPAALEAQAFLTESDDDGQDAESSGSDDVGVPKTGGETQAAIVPHDFGGEVEDEDEIAKIAAKIAMKK